jgi:quercetin dioxygenase-like cupin family protein
MARTNGLLAALVGFGSMVIVGQGVAQAQQSAPKDNKGFRATVEQVVDLGPEIQGLQGRQLRMRLLTIEPGGYIGLHSHKDRPAVVYFLKGTDTVIFADGTKKVFGPGESSAANKDTTHWHRNDGNEPVVLLAVDVFHTTK